MKWEKGHIWFSNESGGQMGAFLKFHPGESRRELCMHTGDMDQM